MSGDLQTLQELVDKETPMKPVKIFERVCCPKCSFPVIIIDNYCPNCGQRLDWSDK